MSLGTIRAENGGIFVNDTDPHAGEWHVMVAITDVTIASVTMPDFTNAAALAGVTIYAGTPLFGEITAITLASGTAQLIKY